MSTEALTSKQHVRPSSRIVATLRIPDELLNREQNEAAMSARCIGHFIDGASSACARVFVIRV